MPRIQCHSDQPTRVQNHQGEQPEVRFDGLCVGQRVDGGSWSPIPKQAKYLYVKVTVHHDDRPKPGILKASLPRATVFDPILELAKCTAGYNAIQGAEAKMRRDWW